MNSQGLPAGLEARVFSHRKIANPGPIVDSLTEAASGDGGGVGVILHFERPEWLSVDERLDTPEARSRVRQVIESAREKIIARIDSPQIAVRRRFDYIAAVAAVVTPAGLDRLLDLPDIVRIEPDLVFEAHTAQGIPLLQASAVRGLYGGSGVSIAVCDTGIDDTHSRLGGGEFPNSKIIRGCDFGDDDSGQGRQRRLFNRGAGQGQNGGRRR